MTLITLIYTDQENPKPLKHGGTEAAEKAILLRIYADERGFKLIGIG